MVSAKILARNIYRYRLDPYRSIPSFLHSLLNYLKVHCPLCSTSVLVPVKKEVGKRQDEQHKKYSHINIGYNTFFLSIIVFKLELSSTSVSTVYKVNTIVSVTNCAFYVSTNIQHRAAKYAEAGTRNNCSFEENYNNTLHYTIQIAQTYLQMYCCIC